MTRWASVILGMGAGCVSLEEPRALSTFDVSLDVASLNRVDISSERGDLQVIGDGEEGRVEVTFTLQSRAPEDPTADAEAEAAVSTSVEPGRPGTADLTWDVAVNDFRVYLDAVVHVPPSVVVDIGDGEGDVSVDGVKGVTLVDGNGDILLARISEFVDVTDDGGDLEVRLSTGLVRIEDGPGDILVVNQEGSVDIVDEGGDIVLRDILGDVLIDDTTGSIQVTRANIVTINDTTGDITATDVAALNVLSKTSGNVTEN